MTQEYLVGSAIAFIVWLIRLEGRVAQGDRDHAETTKQIDILITKHDSLDSKVVEELARVRESLARIEGALGASKGD